MTTPPTNQEIFEQFLRRQLSLEQAADAILTTTMAHKRTGGPQSALAIRKPEGMVMSALDHERADALMAELDRRTSAG